MFLNVSKCLPNVSTRSLNLFFQVLYVAKTNAYGTAKCINDYKCLYNVDSNMPKLNAPMKTVLVNFEIPPEILSANSAVEGKPADLTSIAPSSKCATSSDPKKKVRSKMLEDAVPGKEYPTMDFIDMFVARDELTEMDWVYYIYTYHPVAAAGNNDYQRQPKEPGNTRRRGSVPLKLNFSEQKPHGNPA